MDAGEEIRFRVINELFVDTSPTGPNMAQTNNETTEKKVPFKIIGSVNEPGLGLTSWWTS